MPAGKVRQAAALKAAILLLFIVAAIALVRFTSVKDSTHRDHASAAFLRMPRGLGASGLHPDLQSRGSASFCRAPC